MTSATDRLRALLDERGVEWEADDTQVDNTGTMYCVTYVKEGYGRTWVYEEPPDCDLLVSYNYDLGAEQAVAATIGPGTCEVEGSIIDTYEYNRWEYDLSCGHTIIWESNEPPNYCPECGRKVV